jgi:hypothetical protein
MAGLVKLPTIEQVGLACINKFLFGCSNKAVILSSGIDPGPN